MNALLLNPIHLSKHALNRVAIMRGGMPFTVLAALPLSLMLLVAPCAAVELGPAPPEPLEAEVDGVLGLPMSVEPADLPQLSTQYLMAPELKSLWLQALEQDELLLRQQAIEAFIEAHDYGMEDLDDVPARFVDVLRNDAEPLVRLTAAKALIAFDHHEAAGALLEVMQRDATAEMALTVDPALARWDFEPARNVWRQRVQNTAAPLSARRSAARALGTVADEQAVTPLLALARAHDVPIALRFDIGSALGQITDQGLVTAARELSEGSQAERVMAGAILRQHTDAEAIALLRALINDSDFAVAAVAARSLNYISPQQLFEMRDELAGRSDPSVRYTLVEALGATPLPGSVRTLEQLLDDTSRAVRFRAREALISLARGSDLQKDVFAALDRAIAQHSPAGQEQAALAAGKLDHEAAASRIAELLDSDTWRVRRSAANALRELEVRETLPAILERLQTLTRAAEEGQVQASDVSASHEMLQLIMALGTMRHGPASDLLQAYVPKGSPFPARMRAAAIWALGYIHYDAVDQSLARRLVSRLTDTSPMNPEADNVREYSAITLGLMRADSGVSALKSTHADNASLDIAIACTWAIERITGEDLPAVQPRTSRPRWFLEPR